MTDAPGAQQRLDMRYLVRALIKYNASDLHIKPNRPPLYRINGRLVQAKMVELSSEQIDVLLYSILNDKQKLELEERRQVDLSFLVPNFGRFRCNIFFQKGALSAVIRMIPLTVPNLEDLGVPTVVKELCQRPRGLILVTGATGSGKSTTLAGMVQFINETHYSHILTMEDPIEFIYRDLKSSVTQREVGSDIHSFQDGLRAGLRQDPDVIMIGELRDCNMIQAALTAAETGHLVLSTLHTNDAKSTVDRILDVFPAEGKNQVRIQLASALVAVVSQQLVMRADGTGRAPACEVMVKSPLIENLIMRNELHSIPDAIRTSSDYYKMQTMNRSLIKLVHAGTITPDEAIKGSSNPNELRMVLDGVTSENGQQYDTANTNSRKLA